MNISYDSLTFDLLAIHLPFLIHLIVYSFAMFSLTLLLCYSSFLYPALLFSTFLSHSFSVFSRFSFSLSLSLLLSSILCHSLPISLSFSVAPSVSRLLSLFHSSPFTHLLLLFHSSSHFSLLFSTLFLSSSLSHPV